MPALLTTRDLAIGYARPRQGPHVVAEGLRLVLERGELVCLLGPNGAGKSTLIRTLTGMQAPLRGEVLLEETPLGAIPPRRRAQRLGVVLTEPVRAGMLTAYALVALGRHPHTTWQGRLREADHRAVREALRLVGAADLAERYVSDLSDGERQKVMIARVLAQEADVLVLDEITAFLDLPRRVEVLRLLRDLAHATGRAILLSTHDLDLALRTADRLWLMPPQGPVAVGAPEDLVLSGAFGRTFGREGVAFDADVGAFRMQEPKRGAARVTGEGTEAFWTRRALERIGFDARPTAHPDVAVDVAHEAGRPRWRLTMADDAATFETLGALCQALRPHEAPTPVA